MYVEKHSMLVTKKKYTFKQWQYLYITNNKEGVNEGTTDLQEPAPSTSYGFYTLNKL